MSGKNPNVFSIHLRNSLRLILYKKYMVCKGARRWARALYRSNVSKRLPGRPCWRYAKQDNPTRPDYGSIYLVLNTYFMIFIAPRKQSWYLTTTKNLIYII
jgi:hypothetical protein